MKMEKIKSNYIIQKIFSFIGDEIKLKLIKYNTKIQKQLFIDIINYKLYSGKYI